MIKPELFLAPLEAFLDRPAQTGRASTCHLHFELWTAPGWYEGGKPIDPLPLLKSLAKGDAVAAAR